MEGWGGGCFCFRASKVKSFLSAIVSTEHARRTAPLKSPSSSLEETRDASCSIGSLVDLIVDF